MEVSAAPPAIQPHYLESEFVELLQRDRRIFEFISEGCLDGLWFWDLENPEHKWMNARFWETLGYDLAETPYLAATWQDLIDKDDLSVALENFHKHCSDPSYEYDQIVRYRHKNGSTRWIRCRGLALRNDTGKPTRLIGAHTDVTRLIENSLELSKTNAELIDQRQHYHDLYVNTPAIMHSIDGEGRIVEVSRMWLQEFGYQRDEVVGRRTTEFLTERSQKFAKETVLPQFWKTGKCQSIPYEFICKNGDIVEVELSAIVEADVITGGKHSLAVLVNVSERNAAWHEVQLKNKELETLNQNLESFVFAASHDLQSPIRSIQAYSEIFLEEYADKIGNDGCASIKRITGCARRMSQLITDLLDYSRALRCTGSMHRYNLADVIPGIFARMSVEVEESGMQWSLEQAPIVHADAELIDKLFRNLISNAIKYRHADRAPQINISFQYDTVAKVTLCSVRDNGIGFGMEYSQKIFDPFFRMHGHETIAGSGVGLAICKAICAQHKWAIWAESEENIGSVFYIRIPDSKMDTR